MAITDEALQFASYGVGAILVWHLAFHSRIMRAVGGKRWLLGLGAVACFAWFFSAVGVTGVGWVQQHSESVALVDAGLTVIFISSLTVAWVASTRRAPTHRQ